MEKKNEKVSFFKRVKMAIFNFENYEYFITEKFSVSIKYLLKLSLVLAIVMSAIMTYYTTTKTSKLMNYCANEFPKFSYENGKFEAEKKVNLSVEEYGIALIVDTENLDEKTIQSYKDELISQQAGYLFLYDKVVLCSGGVLQELSYEQFKEEYQLNEEITADVLAQEVEKINLLSIGIVLFLTYIFVYAGVIFITAIASIAVTAVFGQIISKIVGVNLDFKQVFIIAIYSTTLSFVLEIVYLFIREIFSYTIDYFLVMCMMVSYVYIVAAILLLKNNLIKRKEEVQKIVEEQEKIKKQLEQEDLEKQEQEDNKEKKDEKEKNQEKPEDLNIGSEPDGSEI